MKWVDCCRVAFANEAAAKASDECIAAYRDCSSKRDEVDGSRSRHLSAKMGCYHANPSKRSQPPWILAQSASIRPGRRRPKVKTDFQIHGIDATGEVVVRKTLRRAQMLPFFEKLPPCLVGAEACGTSHHWARELTRLGHEVRLMPAAYYRYELMCRITIN